MQAPCGLVVYSVLYMLAIMLMCVQLHYCPLWPSVVLPAIDQGRVSSKLFWDTAVINLSSSGTGMFHVSWLGRWQLVTSVIVSGGNFHAGSFQKTRSRQSVNVQTRLSHQLAIKLLPRVHFKNHFLQADVTCESLNRSYNLGLYNMRKIGRRRVQMINVDSTN